MILVDFSAILYQNLYGSISVVKPQIIDNKYQTSDFIKVTIDFILENLFKYQNDYQSYGQMVLCIDDHSNLNWRKKYLNTYKFKRKKDRDSSQIKFDEVFNETNRLINVLDKYTPFKVVKAKQAEGDDIILTLTKHFRDRTIILSSDKDMIQAQIYNPSIVQISPITLKQITPQTKHANTISEWLKFHICLGDIADGIPKITHNIKFSKNFLDYMKKNNYSFDEYTFNSDQELRIKVLDNYNIYKVNKSGTKTELDVFEDFRLGEASLRKKIQQFGTLQNWINSDINLKTNYELNKKLILSDMIPENIQNEIINNFNKAKIEYNKKEFNNYLKELNLENLLLNLPFNFKSDFSLEW